jgi:hypothetical protein
MDVTKPYKFIGFGAALARSPVAKGALAMCAAGGELWMWLQLLGT